MKHRGFTLVELLIVIVVIGVLSAMMMLSSTEAVSSAEAAKVISNMRNLKTAVLEWYADNLDRVKKNGNNYNVFSTDGTNSQDLPTFTASAAGKAEILKYLNDASFLLSAKTSKGNDNNNGEYIIADVHYKTWYVYYTVGSNTKLKQKLASRAKSLGLKGHSGIGGDPSETEYKKEKYVMLPILELE